MVNLEYKRLTASDEDIQNVHRLLKTVWPHDAKFSIDYLTWLYRDNPAGEAIGVNAVDEKGEVVGHYVVIPTFLIRGDEGASPIPAVLSLNTAVAESARGQGLFVKLADMTYQIAGDMGIKCVYGVANQNSIHGFLKYLGFNLIGPLEMKISMRVAHKEPSDSLNPKILRRYWDEKQMQWRLKNPGGRFSYSKTDQAFLYQLHPLMDIVAHWDPSSFQCPPTSPFNFRLKVHFTREHQLKYKLPSVPVPERYKPSPLNLIFKPLNGDMSLDERVAIEPIDFDLC